MARHHADWLAAFMSHTQHGEAPKHMYFWSGVSAIAGALRRRVWIDQDNFQWYPNFYICLVAPPGIVSKSTTAGLAMSLLRQVPGIHFGPDVVTWPALVEAFADITEAFEYQGEYHPMSALTLESSEFGNLLDPQDKQMVDLLVHLWDGKQGSFEKKTKTNGNNSVENPWINLIACTTPSWIAGNFPEYMIGGGFTSRMVFVYADKKAKLVAYPARHTPKSFRADKKKLIADLTHISTALVGEYKLTDEAETWGEAWYERHHATKPAHLDQAQFGGYLARKQSHLHKLAMILTASNSDHMRIEAETLSIADTMVTDLERDMNFVFSRVGKTDESGFVERLVTFVHTQKRIAYQDAFRYVHMHFPKLRDFEDVLAGCVKAGYIKVVQEEGKPYLLAGLPLAEAEQR